MSVLPLFAGKVVCSLLPTYIWRVTYRFCLYVSGESYLLFTFMCWKSYVAPRLSVQQEPCVALHMYVPIESHVALHLYVSGQSHVELHLYISGQSHVDLHL
jgi:hypothetical protein